MNFMIHDNSPKLTVCFWPILADFPNQVFCFIDFTFKTCNTYRVMNFTHYVLYRLKEKKINPITKFANKTIKNTFSFTL